MKRFLLILLVGIIAVIAGVFMVDHKGYLMVVYGEQIIKMPIWLGVVALLVLIVLIRWFISLLRLVFGFPQHWRRSRQTTKQLKAQVALRELLREGIAANANRLAVDVNFAKQLKPLGFSSEAELLRYRARLARGDYQAVVDDLEKNRYRYHDEALVAWLLGYAHLSLKQFEEAEKWLLQAQSGKKGLCSALYLLKDLYIARKDYAALRDLLPVLLRKGQLSLSEMANLEAQAYVGLLSSARRTSQLALEQFWESTPRKVQKQPAVLAEYLRGLYAFSEGAKADKLLKKKGFKQWSSDLFKAYAEASHHNPEKAFAYLRQQVEYFKPDLSHEEMLLLAGLAVAAGQSALVEQDLLALEQSSPSGALYVILSRLYDGKEMHSKAEQYRKKALLLYNVGV